MPSETTVQLPAPRQSRPATDEDQDRDQAVTFKEVLEAEWNEVRKRRDAWSDTPIAPRPPQADGAPESRRNPDPPPSNLTGLALSGGGIRSATFSLGLLQEMDRLGVLRVFDYLSTVSGGGYAGGWWSAWLSRAGRAKRDIFPPAERILPHRSLRYQLGAGDPSDGAMSAGKDPIHHLRLFANYLTPRKGMLSADTWRAGTIVVRNLILTWLILLPLLLAAVLAGQLFFTLDDDAERSFLRDDFAAGSASGAPATPASRAAPAADALADAEAADRLRARGAEAAASAAREVRGEAILARAEVAARPLAVLLIWVVLLTLLWILYGAGGGAGQLVMTLAGTTGAGVVLVALSSAVRVGDGGWWLPPAWTGVAAVGAIGLVLGFRLVPPVRALLPRRGEDGTGELPMDLLRNRVVRVHAGVLVMLVLSAAVLAVAGFGHDLLWYLFDPASGGPLPDYVKEAGGWAAVLAALGGLLFTGFRGAPSGADGESEQAPGLASRIVFAATPPLALAVLALAAAALGRMLIRETGTAGGLPELNTALVAGVGLFLLFAAYEVLDADPRVAWWKRWLLVAAAALVGALVLALLPGVGSWSAGGVFSLVATAGALILLRWAGPQLDRASRASGAKPAGGWRGRLQRHRRSTVWAGAVSAALAAPVLGVAVFDPELAARGDLRRAMGSMEVPFADYSPSFDQVALAMIAFCGVFAAGELALGRMERWRSVALLSVAYLALAALVLSPFLDLEASCLYASAAALTLLVFALAWVVGLGWMADPNTLSLHAFYRARLVRAYMGASNCGRRAEEITESAVGDDLPIRTLANCDLGAPYHLVNTTLNLVGGRDLTTAQRSADAFLLSRHFCGSSRTGYRPTDEYMGGKLSLGTAVAVSGAAASPNMGSKTPSAALAMCLAFLNVRLAFWAPTPNRTRWRDPQARLWPFYLLRECLSQTNDLSTYCCLSDGGHFDNTGLYSLVARGCRYIVLSDCGADPAPCFEDVGNAIRRCRIDFGAEIELRIDDLGRPDGGHAAAHFVVGTLRYSEAHARSLGWRDWKDEAGRQGTVVWIKPSITATGESADVRQYALENAEFPQQTTGDQWYDEAQFESYRRLGVHTAREVFGALRDRVPAAPEPAAVGAFFDALRSPEPRPKLHFDVDIVYRDGKPALQVVEAAAPERRPRPTAGA